MTERVREAERIVAKWKASAARARNEIARGRKAIGKFASTTDRSLARAFPVPGHSWFAVWDRHAVKIAAALGMLDRATRALERAEDRLTAAKAAQTREERLAPVRASLARYADRLVERAPAAQAGWADDRAKEPKRLKARSNALRKRTTRDLGRTVQWLPPASALAAAELRMPPPVKQPVAELEQPTVPPRADLMPGDYIDPARAKRITDGIISRLASPRLPKHWTPEHVGERMAEAHGVLRRLPMSTRPKEYGAIWPEYHAEAGELAVQAGAGTLELGRNRIIRGTSADEVARMNEAFGWLLDFMSADRFMAADLNEWAFWQWIDPRERASGGREYEAMRLIADQLNLRGDVVR